MARQPINRSLETRVSLNEQRIDIHERECAQRYASLEESIERVGKMLGDQVGQIMEVIGTTEDKGLRAKVADLRSVRDKGKGAWFAIATGCAVVGTLAGWIIAFIT